MKKNSDNKKKEEAKPAKRATSLKKSLNKNGFGEVTVVKAGSSLAALLLSENDTYAAY